MPLFGSRMVCETANYKHIEETKKKIAQREENLGDWVKEKSERKAALQELKLQTRRASECKSRSRSNSIVRSRKNSLVSGTETGNTKPETVQSTRDQDPGTPVSTRDQDSFVMTPSDNKLQAQIFSNFKGEVPDINIEEPPDN